MSSNVSINGRSIGPGEPTYVVAEISANHNHDFDQCVKLIESIHQAGADAVKLQTYTPDTLTIDSDKEPFKITGGTPWDGRNLYDLYKEAHMPWEWQPKLKDVAEQLGLDLFSTPFDSTSVEFLEEMGVPAYKIASFEIVDLPLIHEVARTGKPIVISTGMASDTEIEEALEAARSAGAKEVALLKCTSAYPAPPDQMNLRTIPEMAARFDVPVGLSDHTLDHATSTTAVALGACLVEKHVTLSRKVVGPDSEFSLEPNELEELITAIRQTEASLGSVHYGPEDAETKSMRFRRSLFIVQDMKAGDTFSTDNLRIIRPGNGLHPRYLEKIIGSKIIEDTPKGTPLSWTLLNEVKRGPGTK